MHVYRKDIAITLAQDQMVAIGRHQQCLCTGSGEFGSYRAILFFHNFTRTNSASYYCSRHDLILSF